MAIRINKDARRGVNDTHQRWSSGQKLEAVQTYLVTGSPSMTSAMLKIPEQTLYVWMRQPWWREITEDLRIQDELQLSARLKKVVERSIDVVEDRLDKGDYVYDQKTGKMRRKPVNMRDAAKVAEDMMDRRDLLAGRNVVQASEEQMADKLLKLAKQFEEMAGLKRQELETIEMAPITPDTHERSDNYVESIDIEGIAGDEPGGQPGDDDTLGAEDFGLGLGRPA